MENHTTWMAFRQTDALLAPGGQISGIASRLLRR
jgi:hypothetical protein